MCAVVMGVCDISAKVQITEQYDQVCAESTSIENQNNWEKTTHKEVHYSDD